ncbi:regulatory iron-sulfur-containing complex subunit RicT [Phocaeicola sp.]
MDNEFKLKNGSGCMCCKGCGRQDRQLNTYDWLADIPGNAEEQEMVEVQFKNTRKGYYKNSNKLKLDKGDTVAVEASPGHDIGTVTLTGRLVPLQMRKANIKPDAEIKRIYRKAKPVDMEKYEEAKGKEHDTMIRSRQIAKNLNLDMKIGDVEYQGDGNKAIFYYIADERVDFRQLIKVLAEAFRVRIEMKQIGARQEAGRIGGIGPCGRELCCATWMTNFVSVSTSAARYQDISLNPQKLAGQCAKLKCCLNYEVDAYVESQKRLPSREIPLETVDGTFYFFKADILKGTIMYSTDKNFIANAVTITARRAFEVVNMNKRGEKPESLVESAKKNEPQKPVDLVEQESLTRFDKRKGNNANRKKKRKPEGNGGANGGNNGEGGAPNENRRPREPRENRPQQPREAREPREPREPRENRPQQPREQRETREPREAREPREQREPRENRPPRGENRPQQPRQPRENRPQQPREESGNRNREEGRSREERNNNREERSNREERGNREDRSNREDGGRNNRNRNNRRPNAGNAAGNGGNNGGDNNGSVNTNGNAGSNENNGNNNGNNNSAPNEKPQAPAPNKE